MQGSTDDTFQKLRAKLTIKPQDIYRSFLQYSADGVLVSEASGAIVACNPAFARLCSENPEAIVGRHLSTILDCGCVNGDPNDGEKLLLSTDENLNVHAGTVVSTNGMDLSFPISHSPIKTDDGGESGFLTVVYIIQASSVQQAQTEFVSTVSHELRTPLTSIKGFADTILRAGERLEAGQQKRYVGIIKDQADRLTRLVEDLLAVSRLESRKLQMTIRAIDLNDAVQRVCRNLMEKTRNHKIVTKIPQGLPPVWADADRLEQILTNLVDNAIKYSPAGTTVTIAAREVIARETQENPEMVEIAVTDQGGGITPENINQIFNKFTLLDNPLSRATEGTGLGLYITRSLVLALGGTINVVSEPGETTFVVLLPQATLEKQAARGRG